MICTFYTRGFLIGSNFRSLEISHKNLLCFIEVANLITEETL